MSLELEISASVALIGAIGIAYYYKKSEKPRIGLAFGALFAINAILLVLIPLFTVIC
ncbi:MAG: hypothetical protein JW744_02805 [Candidatus Diapherotrites archaeon]|uniref:Uncharacterized protein n=1 Tax=Candidatus Iainarchaeum sp. TaxID=3101447 RepID=A0A938YNE5_9ARCH|nr:hypothetical protein [Candidatus Diapherotrites archaeon]